MDHDSDVIIDELLPRSCQVGFDLMEDKDGYLWPKDVFSMEKSRQVRGCEKQRPQTVGRCCPSDSWCKKWQLEAHSKAMTQGSSRCVNICSSINLRCMSSLEKFVYFVEYTALHCVP